MEPISTSETHTDERAAKRPRLSSHDEMHVGPTLNVKQSADFWLPDGNIVLQTTDGTRFRVHKGILAMNSLVFRDMFVAVASAAEQQLVDGCALVEVHDGTAEWEVMLNLLYKPSTMNPDRRTLSSNALLAMLRLGRKYQCDDLHAAAEQRLGREFPSDLEAFHEKYDSHLWAIEHNRTRCSCGLMACGKASLVELINYCVAWDIKTTLPAAYFLACARLEFEEVLDGVDLDGGKKLQLCPEAQRAILKGRESLKNAILPLNPARVVPCDDCTDDGMCTEIRDENMETAFLDATSGPSLYAFVLRKLPLDEIVVETEDADIDDMRAFLCHRCIIALQTHTENYRGDIFDDLPEYFGLGTWSDLRKKTRTG